MITRRDLLLARSLRPRVLHLSGERLYMRFIDSRVHGTTADLIEALGAQLQQIDELRVAESAWLADADVSAQLDPVLVAFRARGGRICLA